MTGDIYTLRDTAAVQRVDVELRGVETTLFSNPAGSGKKMLVRNLEITNNNSATAVEATIWRNDADQGPIEIELVRNLAIPAGATVRIVGKDSLEDVELDEGDSISGYANAVDSLVVTVVHEEVRQ